MRTPLGLLHQLAPKPRAHVVVRAVAAIALFVAALDVHLALLLHLLVVLQVKIVEDGRDDKVDQDEARKQPPAREEDGSDDDRDGRVAGKVGVGRIPLRLHCVVHDVLPIVGAGHSEEVQERLQKGVEVVPRRVRASLAVVEQPVVDRKAVVAVRVQELSVGVLPAKVVHGEERHAHHPQEVECEHVDNGQGRLGQAYQQVMQEPHADEHTVEAHQLERGEEAVALPVVDRRDLDDARDHRQRQVDQIALGLEEVAAQEHHLDEHLEHEQEREGQLDVVEKTQLGRAVAVAARGLRHHVAQHKRRGDVAVRLGQEDLLSLFLHSVQVADVLLLEHPAALLRFVHETVDFGRRAWILEQLRLANGLGEHGDEQACEDERHKDEQEHKVERDKVRVLGLLERVHRQRPARRGHCVDDDEQRAAKVVERAEAVVVAERRLADKTAGALDALGHGVVHRRVGQEVDRCGAVGKVRADVGADGGVCERVNVLAACGHGQGRGDRVVQVRAGVVGRGVDEALARHRPGKGALPDQCKQRHEEQEEERDVEQ
eukprot:Unigene4471_Nuclearia_a/m.13662 Unigene4471_Nuclearia_a/g.13662  ORF Unigene4471_Nuclearia_a/g.13662 Unigene4471_Nuclearia_a/m.13662 type:complete len:545 (+) Unigene4471_Nuclearia_a:1009-2643(+)